MASSHEYDPNVLPRGTSTPLPSPNNSTHNSSFHTRSFQNIHLFVPSSPNHNLNTPLPRQNCGTTNESCHNIRAAEYPAHSNTSSCRNLDLVGTPDLAPAWINYAHNASAASSARSLGRSTEVTHVQPQQPIPDATPWKGTFGLISLASRAQFQLC